MAWQEAAVVPGECVLAAPAQVESLAAAVKSATTAAEGVVPRFEIFGGVALPAIGDKYAGLAGNPPSPLVSWGAIFDRGTGFDVQVVLRRPPRAAQTLSTGDTFVVIRGALESYAGKTFMFDGNANSSSDGMTIFGGWFEGRTVLNAVDAARSLRPYLQYGGGAMYYSAVAVNGAAYWDATVALGWRMALGLELRKGRLGIYAEGGIQVVGPPDVAQYYYDLGDQDEIDKRIAQDLVTYPLRLGMMIGF